MCTSGIDCCLKCTKYTITPFNEGLFCGLGSSSIITGLVYQANWAKSKIPTTTDQCMLGLAKF